MPSARWVPRPRWPTATPPPCALLDSSSPSRRQEPAARLPAKSSDWRGCTSIVHKETLAPRVVPSAAAHPTAEEAAFEETRSDSWTGSGTRRHRDARGGNRWKLDPVLPARASDSRPRREHELRRHLGNQPGQLPDLVGLHLPDHRRRRPLRPGQGHHLRPGWNLRSVRHLELLAQRPRPGDQLSGRESDDRRMENVGTTRPSSGSGTSPTWPSRGSPSRTPASPTPSTAATGSRSITRPMSGFTSTPSATPPATAW